MRKEEEIRTLDWSFPVAYSYLKGRIIRHLSENSAKIKNSYLIFLYMRLNIQAERNQQVFRGYFKARWNYWGLRRYMNTKMFISNFIIEISFLRGISLNAI
jgi:hypothetical protein